ENDKLDSTPLERRNQILTKLLFNAPLANRVSEMYEDFFVSIELIHQDLTIISKQLQKYDLSLKRDGSFVSVVGDERNIRRAINAVLVHGIALHQD
ncbi:helix-turn-helix domain-containing protein, partial [Roseburia faecis]|nr:helix-turn-helix domain-containing protein [Roseburia faecis]